MGMGAFSPKCRYQLQKVNLYYTTPGWSYLLLHRKLPLTGDPGKWQGVYPLSGYRCVRAEFVELAMLQ